MASNPKSRAGCWTCRLRHKKCDESLPVCTNCGALEISCHYAVEKPEWMDNGKRQHQMAQQVKAAIKHNAKRRRGRAQIQSIAQYIQDSPNEALWSDHNPSSQSLGHVDPSSPTNQSPADDASNDPFPVSREKPRRGPLSGISEEVASTQPCTSLGSPVELVVQATQPLPVSHQTELELSFIMAYLDYAFPVLFPFYKPSILEGGRSWLLVWAMRRNAFYHNVISLTTYFVSVMPIALGPEHKACASKTWGELRNQMDKVVQNVQGSLQDVTRRGVRDALLDSSCLLGNIVQLVNFEVIIAPSGNWQIHLAAAVDLFEQIIRHHGSGQSTPVISTILDKMSSTLLIPTPSLWTADQAAFRFYSAMLLVEDIISSTSLEQAPRLRHYYDDLLYNDQEPGNDRLLKLEDFVGCQTWALLLVGEIATLDRWKKDLKKDGKLSTVELFHRASLIKQRLRDGIARLDRTHPRQQSQPSSGPNRPLDTLLGQSNALHSSQPYEADLSVPVTRIWAHAADTYLLIVLSGWQPANLEVRNNVAQTIDLLTKVTSPSWLRSLTWPFCVAGCLATEDQESAFREMVNSTGTLNMFGTVRDALNIMENVWRNRQQLDADTWDLAACLRNLGYKVLLV